MWNEQDVAEYKSILDSVDDSPIDGDSYDGYISTNDLEYIRDGIQIRPDINARYSRLKIRDRIRQM